MRSFKLSIALTVFVFCYDSPLNKNCRIKAKNNYLFIYTLFCVFNTGVLLVMLIISISYSRACIVCLNVEVNSQIQAIPKT